MSRHSIVLSSSIPAKAPGQGGSIDQALVVCGFDRHPYKHFFCNVSDAKVPDSEFEPLWSSVEDAEYSRVITADGFDTYLVKLGIALPDYIKAALKDDWVSEDMKRVEIWHQKASFEESVL